MQSRYESAHLHGKAGRTTGFFSLLQVLEGMWNTAGIGLAGEGGDVYAFLVQDYDFGGGDAVMAADDAAFGAEDISFAGGYVVVDGGVDGEREELALIHERGEHEVGEREDGSALADAAGVEVSGAHFHLGPGGAGADFDELRTAGGGEAVACVKVVFESHCAGNEGFCRHKYRKPSSRNDADAACFLIENAVE